MGTMDEIADGLRADAGALVKEFARGYAFQLDDFQRRACLALAGGRGALVAAPTGSGKTVVGEFAVWLALRSGTKAFYTTPLKALSNQKFGDFVARHGGARVGLLTGDNAINGEARVVVMTTEVLRNMLYEGSPTLAGLGRGGEDVGPNRALARRGEREWRPGRDSKGRHGPRPAGRGWVPSRVEVVDLLEAERLLPAIYFIFSRAGCDRALDQCRAAGVRVTSQDER